MKSKGLAYLFWLIGAFGALGFHRLYLGKPVTGILWLLTSGLFMVGAIADLFTLPGQVDDVNAERFGPDTA